MFPLRRPQISTSIYVSAQRSQPKLSRKRWANVPQALQNNTVFKCTQNWVSVSDGSRTLCHNVFCVGDGKCFWAHLVVLEWSTTVLTLNFYSQPYNNWYPRKKDSRQMSNLDVVQMDSNFSNNWIACRRRSAFWWQVIVTSRFQIISTGNLLLCTHTEVNVFYIV